MKTALKIIAGIFVVIVIAVTVAITTFDPNAYKTQITEAVEQHTGRTLNIDGKISLSFFPWIGLEVDKLSLSNAKGFSQSAFARIDQLDIKVKLLPLLARNVEIDKIGLHGLFVSLETHRDGKTNWQDLAQPGASAATEQKSTPEPTADNAGTSSALTGLLVGGVELASANIQWLDDQSGTHAKISDLSLTTGKIQFDEWVPVSFSAKVNSDAPKLDLKIALDTRLKFNREFNALDVQKLKLSTMGLELLADLAVTQLDKTPAIKGSVALSDFNLRELAKQFDVALPDSANPSRLTSFGLSAEVDATAKRANLDKVIIRLDDSRITGYVHVPDLAKQSLRYQLKLDQIDVDSYLPTPLAEVAPEAVAAASSEDVEIALPVEMLRKLDLDGELQIASLKVKQIDITELRMVSKARAGVISLAPVSMKLLQGSMNAELGLNVQTKSRYDIKLDAKNIVLESVVNPLLVGLLKGEDLQLQGGVANLNLAVTTQGQWLSELKRAANGALNVNANKASMTGIDVDYFLRNSIADYLASKGGKIRDDWRGTYTPGEKTAFNSFIANSTIASGKLTNDKLAIDSSRMKVNGTGVIDLMNNSIDEKLTVTVLKKARQQTTAQQTTEDQIMTKPIPVRIRGPFAALQYDVDKSWLSSAVGGLVKAKTKAKVEEKTQEKVQEQKQKLEEKAKDKLKGLFR